MSWDILPKAKLQYLLTRLKEIFDTKVDKETGKGLFSGSYNDLTNKPSLATVATSGSYNDLSNKPSLATVATSGSYNDLSNKPTIPAAQVNSNWNATSGVSQILNKPSLSTVATSGSYNDLSNKPTIPSVGNGTITIQSNGTTKGSFTTNQSGNTTINLPDTNTNDAVTQTGTLAITSNNKWFRMLYSATADDTTRTEGARKGIISFNPVARAIAFANTNSYLLSCQTNKSLIMYNDGDGDHGLCHRAVNGDGNQWGLMPYRDGWLSLGHGSYRWGQIYSTSGSISTSDRNEKKDISPLDDKARDFIMALNPVSYKFIDGKTGRTHYGMISQDVEEEMLSLGMTDMDFAGFCKDQKMEEHYIENEDGTKTPDFKYLDDYRYGLRYEEFIAPLIKTVQLQQQEIEELKHRIDILEGK
ncbi:MAG: tail fiber domain-containing protein [Pseudobutyrivibrio sp.]|nr:tail fiber domain-containing protein [Pseudobutyrivibrio sp.]